MSMMTILLLIILMLLVFILAMMFTVLPRRQHAEIEKAVSALRREMAEYRGDSMRLMQAIRNEVEDAVQESLDREVADFMRSRGRSAVPPPCSEVPVCEGKSAGSVKEGKKNAQGQGGTAKYSTQLSLFEQTGPVASVSSAEKEKVDKMPDEPESEEMERIQVIIDDDIPDIDDIPDLEDIK
ncbi:hypothetical protein [Prosthecochloris sp.]|uniref:hypothetical protein n=1 Tax=Prosthecochloris sp. TaxID=290513 RepID=UPI00257FBFDD|nr:hypothetical protein [Prosthecochloris sp.]